MARAATTLRRVLSGRAYANVRFADLVNLLLNLGFALRINGDHHIFTRDGVPEIINMQPLGSMAKTYQVQQVRRTIVRHQLGGPNNA